VPLISVYSASKSPTSSPTSYPTSNIVPYTHEFKSYVFIALVFFDAINMLVICSLLRIFMLSLKENDNIPKNDTNKENAIKIKIIIDNLFSLDTKTLFTCFLRLTVVVSILTVLNLKVDQYKQWIFYISNIYVYFIIPLQICFFTINPISGVKDQRKYSKVSVVNDSKVSVEKDKRKRSNVLGEKATPGEKDRLIEDESENQDLDVNTPEGKKRFQQKVSQIANA